MPQHKEAKFKGIMTIGKNKITVDLFVIQFEDNGCPVAYCPALNVYGYGNSEEEARRSFELCLSEFFDYTTTKHTLIRELESLGWKIHNRIAN